MTSAGRIAEPPEGVKVLGPGCSGPGAILTAVRILALDLGDARIGVALSDETETLASGLPTLRAFSPRRDAQAIAALVREHGVDEVVVGVPWRLDGSPGSRAQQALAFVERLRRVLDVEVSPVDERLSSVAADELLAEAGLRRRDRRRRLDRAAATLILQEYLDRRKAAAVVAGGGRAG